MSTAKIKSAFASELGNAGTCSQCTLQYLDGGKQQLLRFYVRRAGAPEEVFSLTVPARANLIAAVQEKAREIRDGAGQT